MKIELVSKPKEYDNFITNNFCSFYQSFKHIKFLESILQINAKFITAKDGENIIGVMPIFCKESKLGTVINSLPFFGSYGGIISKSIEVKKNILNFLNNYNKENDIISTVIISNPFEKSDVYDKNFKFVDKVERLAQCINLSKYSEKKLWDNFEQRVRRAIRKAEKNSITIEYSKPNKEIIEKFYNYHVKNMSSKKGAVKPKEFFECVKENFKIHEDYDILIAKYNFKPISFLLVFYFKSFTEYYMPAYDVEKSNLQGTSLLIWESIKKSFEKKIQYYNFGGTHKKQDTLYNFKKGWATNDFFYNYYIYSDLSRLEGIEQDYLKKNFKNFYVYNFNKVQIKREN
ncbi:peptidoglycan bridge formation glycyltransferase FemA/FemB family protein [Nitrosopumilus sp. K4]|uniref:peptidoglycan bridge formation glycyltransferase FemA/FemB family protein n=1 Tax=Nitrosopumilus sp. K4 TaxID=2795383 RepID=UPI001BAE3CE5|nr:peptidoglycan bridge formation glycyltransferase FemA/FemB family protein [Nitrosopumilus sp. K4]QUC64453.1 peptidoglycan bridge formation glycyltransferase FemA/FemB family protein [Nitrosopumilus sp. K4]